MAPLPKRRHSTRRGGKRKAAHTIPLLGLISCPHCHNLKLPHQICPKCGYYENREVVKQKVKKEKK